MKHGNIVFNSAVSRLRWCINNFNAVIKKVLGNRSNEHWIESPVIAINSSTKCRLKFDAREYKIGGWMSFLFIYSSDQDFIVTSKLFVLCNNVATAACARTETNLCTNIFEHRYSIDHETCLAKELVENDTLKILCEITVLAAFDEGYYGSNVGPIYQIKEFDDLEKLLKTANHSDITFKVADEKFEAHKAIISCRSPIFEAMFAHPMKEKEKNEVELIDIKPEIMKQVLQFMYTSSVTDIEETVSDLLEAAERFAILDLKSLCEKVMSNNLKVENVLQHLKSASMYNAVQLKSKVIDFIVKHKKNIVHDLDFLSFVISDPELSYEVMRAITPKSETS